MNSDLSHIREKGLKILVKELGPVDAVQFMSQFEKGNGNYTEERQEALKGITIEQIAARIAQRKTIA
jgi:hypothetical protein